MAAIELALKRHGPLSRFGKFGAKGKTLFYRSEKAIASRKFNGEKSVLLEVMPAGRQTVIPPTIHPDTGRPYQWLEPNFTLLTHRVEQLPALSPEIVEDLEQALQPWLRHPEKPKEWDFKPRKDTRPPGDLETRRYRAWLDVKLAAQCAELARMGRNTGRNDQAFRLVCAVARFAHHCIVPKDMIVNAIMDACEANGLMKEDGRRSVEATIQSGFHAARNDPLPDLEDRPQSGAPHFGRRPGRGRRAALQEVRGRPVMPGNAITGESLKAARQSFVTEGHLISRPRRSSGYGSDAFLGARLLLLPVIQAWGKASCRSMSRPWFPPAAHGRTTAKHRWGT